MLEEKESIFKYFLTKIKRFFGIKEKPKDIGDMCAQAQGSCSGFCESCTWFPRQ